MQFLGFFDEEQHIKTRDSNGKPISCLDSFGAVMASKMTHGEDDRDLVVMRHNFIMEDETRKRWAHSSTWIESGQSHKSGGTSLMSKSVGITTAIGTRMVLEGKVKRRGVLSPIYKDIYEPILAQLENHGITMLEESERPGAVQPRRAKL
jgi:saccharopine dehydrogenase-like NADP-dependent oxidoreductase